MEGTNMDIADLKKEPHLSATAVNDYIECGLLYKLGRIDKVQPEFTSDALEFGAVIHEVLAEFYQEKMVGDKPLLKQLHQSFEKHWTVSAEGRDDIRYAEGKDFETLLREGKELLTAYYHKLPEDNFTTLAIEEPFSLTIEDLPVPIIGVVDLIEQDQAGTVVITDWKTSSRSYSVDEVEQNFQLSVYQVAIKGSGFNDRDILLRLDCLIKTKTPKFEQYYTTRGKPDERRTVKKILQVWEGIEKGVFIPNDTSWRCKNCAYKNHCDEWFGR
jgi:putative RecB family exonuclease